METQSAPLPILQYGTRNRKYGRYDFERFDHLSSSPANIGHGTFHKVNVNCRFLFTKSRWGVLGQHKNPAGIIYLDLTFDQPRDCQLYSATVIVTLDDEDEELHALRHRRSSQCPIQLTDYYGPKTFMGSEKIAQTRSSTHFTPNAQFAGFGIGGMGVNREFSSTSSSRWKFSGSLLPGKKNGWTLKTLKWDLSENDLEGQSTHSNEVHTAFTFEHGGQPFFMRVEIRGKLKKLRGKMKDKLMKFPSMVKKDDNSIVTLIDFGERIQFTTPLDDRAQTLQFEMERANLHAIPMEVSDPKPVTFQNIPQNLKLSNVSGSTAPPGSWSHLQSSISNGSPQQQLPTLVQPHLLQEAEDANDPMLADLAQAFASLNTVSRDATDSSLKEQIQASANLNTMDSRISDHDDTTKLSPIKFVKSETKNAKLDNERGDETNITMSSRTDQETDDEIVEAISSARREERKLLDDKVLLQLLSLPGLLLFLRAVIVVSEFFRQISPLTNVGKKSNEKSRVQIAEMATDKSHVLLEKDSSLNKETT